MPEPAEREQIHVKLYPSEGDAVEDHPQVADYVERGYAVEDVRLVRELVGATIYRVNLVRKTDR